ncbi:hypothetical protein RHGRI_025961 [Rhododendron griersonianum]|uniref:Uncharacterized protein n=1 Tax=Rhododendron griersonianum TaxID=479676 RepID=A0AAV6ITC2_9ERIC|nr:hypothetical protein RHGRI_025961 [Rhododendron griersonianum]
MASASDSDVDNQDTLLQRSCSRRRRDSDDSKDSDDGRGGRDRFRRRLQTMTLPRQVYSIFGLRFPVYMASELVGVALVLCQSNHVLIDGQSGSEQSRNAVLDGVRQRLIEKVVRDHEDDDGGSSSD